VARSQERLREPTDRIREDVGVSEEIELDVQGMT
jgi:hypothetical protein